ncbi:Baculovirus repeated ORF 7 [Trabala vishnou gigantina nucleopolyhedrovirus]|uniref:Baculovirus repeated ORF 7 n=1 Tax=Trabala vishnou gigantina nucleopolyhedrovirus TaxID=2863583 RepID=UPI0024820E89|nr:Baculovirus repeated ORF 7 [Trabala vishnou gigantina nucleopolyhedrovirus]QYC92708.1 Baculovirus repeated ORF 7 [Trabala vishnou gigantina nucleopolyhedrovirus]
MLANPFAKILDYSRTNDSVRQHVSSQNQKNYNEIQVRRIDVDDSSVSSRKLHSQSKFINRAGLFELIQGSKMPKAQEFKNWINSDLLPKLCDEGNYSMERNAPLEIARGMNAVHAATNEGREAPWAKDIDGLRQDFALKDKIISDQNVIITKCLQTIENKDKLLAEKDKRVDALLHRVMDVSERAVDYPARAAKEPTLCVVKEGKRYFAITGQRPYVDKVKRKRLVSDDRVVLDSRRPNPNVDWNNLRDKVRRALNEETYTCVNREVDFESTQDSDYFESEVKKLAPTKKSGGDDNELISVKP